jgi:hypothetical protein
LVRSIKKCEISLFRVLSSTDVFLKHFKLSSPGISRTDLFSSVTFIAIDRNFKFIRMTVIKIDDFFYPPEYKNTFWFDLVHFRQIQNSPPPSFLDNYFSIHALGVSKTIDQRPSQNSGHNRAQKNPGQIAGKINYLLEIVTEIFPQQNIDNDP